MTPIAIRRLPHRSIHVSPEISDTVKAHSSVIRKNTAVNEFTELAVSLAVLLAPPIVYTDQGDIHYCVANLRSLHLAQRLPERTKIPVVVISKEDLLPMNVRAAQMELVGALCAGLDERFSSGGLRLLWESIQTAEARRELSVDFVSKVRFGEVTNTNRRDFSRKTKRFRSEFLARAED